MRLLLATLALLSAHFFIPDADAQTPVVTQPVPRISNNNSGSVSVTNTFQSIWVANVNRLSCTIQNNGTHNMYVFFGPIANATLTNSVILLPTLPLNCQIFGVILSDQVSITGTSGDAFFAAQQ